MATGHDRTGMETWAPGARRAHRGLAVVVVGMFLAGACSTDSPAADDAAPAGFAAPTDRSTGSPVETMPTTPVTFDDGRIRVVVITDANPGLRVIEPDRSDPVEDGDTGGRDVPVELSWRELSDAGARSLGEPSKSLRPVHPVDDVERAIRDAAPTGSMVAVDDRGEVGDEGARYLRTLTELYSMDELRHVAEGLIADAPRSADAADTTADEGDDITSAGATSGATTDSTPSGDADIVAVIAGLSGVFEVTRAADGVLSVVLDDPRVAEQLSLIDGVVEVMPDGVLRLGSDPRQGEQWMIDNTGSGAQAGGWPGVVGADTGVDAAWEVTTGAGVVVAVVDSGVDTQHPDLAAGIWTNPDEVCGNGVDDDGNGYTDDCHGWDFGMSDGVADPDPTDSNGFHGTHVAGLVGAGRNGVGVVGMAPDATIMPLKVSDSGGGILTSWVASAIQYAVDEGADVINLSLGSTPGQPRSHHYPVELAIAHARANGVLVVAAMGNDGVDTTSAPVWPADFARYYDNVLAVGASTNSDTAAWFSNRGIGLGVWAPGWFTLSTMPGGSYGHSSGTSMASPVAAGAAALVKASGMATAPADIRSRLAATAAPTAAGPRLDAAAAVGASTAPVTGALLEVTMTGGDGLEPDTEGTVSFDVRTADPAGIAGFEMLVAARSGGVVGAVEGVVATFATAGGTPTPMTSDLAGSLGVVPVDDPSALATGVTISATMTLPAADYAFMLRAVDDAGEPASDGYATFASLPAPFTAPPPSEPSGGDTGGSASGSDGTSGGSTGTIVVSPSPGSTTGGTTTGGSGGSTTTGGFSTTDGSTTTGGFSTTGGSGTGGSGGDGWTTTTGGWTTTTGGSGGGGSTTTTGGVSSTGGSSGEVVFDPGPAPTDPSTPTSPTEPVSTSAPSGGSSSGSGDADEPEEPGRSDDAEPADNVASTVPPSTTPSPPPATSGEYTLASMSPRSATVDGGVLSSLRGRFPTTVPIYVWYGEGWSSVVQAIVISETEILSIAPPVAEPGVRDVRVRFATDESHDLRLAEAFTYVARSESGSGGPSAGSSSSGSGETSDPAPTPSQPVDGGTGDDPGGAPPPSGGSSGGDDPGTAPPPPSSGGGSPGGVVGSSGEPAIRGTIGDLTLREVRAGDALHGLAAIVWPTRECASSCSAIRIA